MGGVPFRKIWMNDTTSILGGDGHQAETILFSASQQRMFII
jgi:hypothetical protein